MQHRREVRSRSPLSHDVGRLPKQHCSHPQLLEMELDVLYAHIGSAPVVAGFPALARRIADKGFPHGADIIVGIHARLLTERQPFPSASVPTEHAPPSSPRSPSVKPQPSSAVAESPREKVANELSQPTLRCQWDEGKKVKAQPFGFGLIDAFQVEKEKEPKSNSFGGGKKLGAGAGEKRKGR